MLPRNTVAVVDDHPLYRQGVAQAFRQSRKFEVVGEGGTAQDAVAIANDTRPNILVLDIQLPGGGLDAAGTILARHAATRIILLTVVEDMSCVTQAFRMGVSGYLLKGVGVSELLRSAEAVLAGERCVAPQLMGHLLDQMSGRTRHVDRQDQLSFSNREEQILALLAEGKSNKEIAFRLTICEKTAKFYLTGIMRKLGARNRVEVALYASRREQGMTAAEML